MLTLFRLALIPVFPLVFFSNLEHNFLYALVIFLLAGITDILDGAIARKYNLITKWGIVLDPLADKLMLICVLICLFLDSYIPKAVVIVVILKEFFMILSGIFLYKKDTVIPSNILGKASTFLFYIAVVTLAFNQKIGLLAVYIAVFSAIIALTNYAFVYFKGKNNL
jgi:cardiolipin synthase